MKPWRMLKEAMLPGVDLGAGVAMVDVVWGVVGVLQAVLETLERKRGNNNGSRVGLGELAKSAEII